MHEGRVTQFGPTGAVYRRPDDLISAKVFSEPPINVATVEKRGGDFMLGGGGGARWQAGEKAAGRGEGSYLHGIRPHHVTPAEAGAQPVLIEGDVLVTELSGSESIIHFEMGGSTWISQAHGIHPFRVGERARLYADMAAAMIFHPDGRLIAA
jgi:glycerol transport system ATP-binding protein